AGLFALTGSAIQRRETEMAVSDERPHAESGRERERATVVVFGRRHIVEIASAYRDVAKQAERPRLVTTFSMKVRQRQRFLRALDGIVEPSVERTCFAEPDELDGPSDPHRVHRGV